MVSVILGNFPCVHHLTVNRSTPEGWRSDTGKWSGFLQLLSAIIFMPPRCACASEVYGSRFCECVCVCVCVCVCSACISQAAEN